MSQSKRVLILDDDPDIASILAATAESFGFEVLPITSPLSAAPVVRAWCPSQVLLDLTMPQRDGIEVIRDLAKHEHPYSLILMSGLDSKVLESARTFARLQGFHVKAILNKPFCRSELKRALMLEIHDEPKTKQFGNGLFTPSAEELGVALEQNQLQLYYQPTIKLSDLSLVGAEALVRWQHPERGVLTPDCFLDTALNSGLMGKLTHRVLDLGIKWLKVTEGVGANLAVNITGSDLCDLSLVDTVLAECSESGVDAARLTLELTESSAVSHSATCLDVLTRFRIHGVRLAIDDFGTGHSTLKQLRTLPFSEIKIDRSFVQTMTESFESLAIVESTIRLGKDLGLVTVAEGVEDGRTLSMLRSLGCDWAQGYLFSRPVPESESLRLLSGWPQRVAEIREKEKSGENLNEGRKCRDSKLAECYSA